MKSVRNIILWVSVFLGFFVNSFARELPFTDMPESSPYYSAVKYLYDQGIISDDGSHLFRDTDTIARDTFIGLSVSVSCRKCITPTPDDVIRYQVSPFIDLSKANPYFYCTAYAAEKDIVQGYLPDQTGQSSCQNGKKYNSNPFCENNKTSRIEAAGVLLRQAKLWDDTMNRNYTPAMSINDPDLTSYWRGYAEKWIQAGIITLKNGRVFPNEYITRGEFALMAAKMLSYNQCKTRQSDLSVASEIRVTTPSGQTTDISAIPLWYTGSLSVITSTWSWNYTWTLSHPVSSTVLTGTGVNYPINQMNQCGTWIAVVEVRDSITGVVVSSSHITITISCPWTYGPIALSIRATPLITIVDTPVQMNSTVSGNSGSIAYSWNLWDSTTTGWANPIHPYAIAWTYTVSLTVTDTTWATATAHITIIVIGDDDSDDDGVPDIKDLCPTIVWTPANRWCPVFTPFDPYTGSTTTTGTPPGISVSTNPIYNPIQNICLTRKLEWSGLIVAYPVCEQCPCSNKIEILTTMRSCDILFPTILSKDKESIFSRWWLYQIP